MEKVKKLKNAPLQEVIFEVRWELDVENNIEIDSNFEMAIGILASITKKKFPLSLRKFPSDFPWQNIPPFTPIIQYRTDEKSYPLLQLGQGVFTVNDTEKNYIWEENYFPLIKESLNWLFEAYNNKIKLNYASFRYIDSVPMKKFGFEKNVSAFVMDNFNFSFKNEFNTRANLGDIHFTQSFELGNNKNLLITMSSGKTVKDKNDVFIWQNRIQEKKEFTKDEVINWADESHNLLSPLFKEMLKEKFYEQFN